MNAEYLSENAAVQRSRKTGTFEGRKEYRPMTEQMEKTFEEKLKVQNQLKGGARWFFWIAGLSLVNSLILFAGGEWGFICGLGITHIIDAIGLMVSEEIGTVGKVAAFVFNLIPAGLFVVFGVFARKRYSWAFILGMIFYTLDGLLFLLVMDLLSIGFHIFALFFIYGGLKAGKRLSELEAGDRLGGGGFPAPEPQAGLVGEQQQGGMYEH